MEAQSKLINDKWILLSYEKISPRNLKAHIQTYKVLTSFPASYVSCGKGPDGRNSLFPGYKLSRQEWVPRLLCWVQKTMWTVIVMKDLWTMDWKSGNKHLMHGPLYIKCWSLSCTIWPNITTWVRNAEWQLALPVPGEASHPATTIKTLDPHFF